MIEIALHDELPRAVSGYLAHRGLPPRAPTGSEPLFTDLRGAPPVSTLRRETHSARSRHLSRSRSRASPRRERYFCLGRGKPHLARLSPRDAPRRPSPRRHRRLLRGGVRARARCLRRARAAAISQSRHRPFAHGRHRRAHRHGRPWAAPTSGDHLRKRREAGRGPVRERLLLRAARLKAARQCRVAARRALRRAPAGVLLSVALRRAVACDRAAGEDGNEQRGEKRLRYRQMFLVPITSSSAVPFWLTCDEPRQRGRQDFIDRRRRSSVMIEKFAVARSTRQSEFLDLNHCQAASPSDREVRLVLAARSDELRDRDSGDDERHLNRLVKAAAIRRQTPRRYGRYCRATGPGSARAIRRRRSCPTATSSASGSMINGLVLALSS